MAAGRCRGCYQRPPHRAQFIVFRMVVRYLWVILLMVGNAATFRRYSVCGFDGEKQNDSISRAYRKIRKTFLQSNQPNRAVNRLCERSGCIIIIVVLGICVISVYDSPHTLIHTSSAVAVNSRHTTANHIQYSIYIYVYTTMRTHQRTVAR